MMKLEDKRMSGPDATSSAKRQAW